MHARWAHHIAVLDVQPLAVQAQVLGHMVARNPTHSQEVPSLAALIAHQTSLEAFGGSISREEAEAVVWLGTMYKQVWGELLAMVGENHHPARRPVKADVEVRQRYADVCQGIAMQRAAGQLVYAVARCAVERITLGVRAGSKRGAVLTSLPSGVIVPTQTASLFDVVAAAEQEMQAQIDDIDAAAGLTARGMVG